MGRTGRSKWGMALLLAALLVLGARYTAWAGPNAQTIPTAAGDFLEKKGEEEGPTPTPVQEISPTPSPTTQTETTNLTPSPTEAGGSIPPGAFSGLFAGLPIWLWFCCGAAFILLLLPFIIWVLRSRREDEDEAPEGMEEMPEEEEPEPVNMGESNREEMP